MGRWENTDRRWPRKSTVHISGKCRPVMPSATISFNAANSKPGTQQYVSWLLPRPTAVSTTKHAPALFAAKQSSPYQPTASQSVSHGQRTEPSTPTPFATVAWEREGNVQALVDSKLEELAFHAVLEATSNAANVDSTTAGVAFLNDAGGDWL